MIDEVLSDAKKVSVIEKLEQFKVDQFKSLKVINPEKNIITQSAKNVCYLDETKKISFYNDNTNIIKYA